MTICRENDSHSIVQKIDPGVVEFKWDAPRQERNFVYEVKTLTGYPCHHDREPAIIVSASFV